MKNQSKSTSKKIQPLADRVLVKREDAPDVKSPAGIIIPDTAQKDKSKYGVVVAVGPGRTTDDGKLIPVSVKIGAKIVFNAGWDNEVDMGEKDQAYFLVKESDILAIIK